MADSVQSWLTGNSLALYQSSYRFVTSQGSELTILGLGGAKGSLYLVDDDHPEDGELEVSYKAATFGAGKTLFPILGIAKSTKDMPTDPSCVGQVAPCFGRRTFTVEA